MSSTIWKSTPSSLAKLRNDVDCVRFVGPVEEQHALDAGRDQPSGLELVQPPQALGPVGGAVPATSMYWPADHPLDPGRGGQLARRRSTLRRLAALLGQQQPERLGVERVAGEDRDVLAERLVAGRAAATQVVVVHRRQVVVDQRVGVDQLDRRGERQHRRRGSMPIASAVASASTGRIRLPPASSE